MKRKDPTVETEITEEVAQEILISLGLEPTLAPEQSNQAKPRVRMKKMRLWQIDVEAAKQSEWMFIQNYENFKDIFLLENNLILGVDALNLRLLLVLAFFIENYINNKNSIFSASTISSELERLGISYDYTNYLSTDIPKLVKLGLVRVVEKTGAQAVENIVDLLMNLIPDSNELQLNMEECALIKSVLQKVVSLFPESELSKYFQLINSNEQQDVRPMSFSDFKRSNNENGIVIDLAIPDVDQVSWKFNLTEEDKKYESVKTAMFGVLVKNKIYRKNKALSYSQLQAILEVVCGGVNAEYLNVGSQVLRQHNLIAHPKRDHYQLPADIEHTLSAAKFHKFQQVYCNIVRECDPNFILNTNNNGSSEQVTQSAATTESVITPVVSYQPNNENDSYYKTQVLSPDKYLTFWHPHMQTQVDKPVRAVKPSNNANKKIWKFTTLPKELLMLDSDNILDKSKLIAFAFMVENYWGNGNKPISDIDVRDTVIEAGMPKDIMNYVSVALNELKKYKMVSLFGRTSKYILPDQIAWTPKNEKNGQLFSNFQIIYNLIYQMYNPSNNMQSTNNLSCVLNIS